MKENDSASASDYVVHRKDGTVHSVTHYKKGGQRVPGQRRGLDSLRESRDRLREGPPKAYGSTWGDMENATWGDLEKRQDPQAAEDATTSEGRKTRRTQYICAAVLLAGALSAPFITNWLNDDDPDPAPAPDRPAQIEPAPPTAPPPIPSSAPAPSPIPPG